MKGHVASAQWMYVQVHTLQAHYFTSFGAARLTVMLMRSLACSDHDWVHGLELKCACHAIRQQDMHVAFCPFESKLEFHEDMGLTNIHKVLI